MRTTLLFFFFTCRLLSQSWVQLPDFPGTQRDDGVVFVINQKAYCLSGLDVGFNCTGNGFAFDGSSETWSPMASLPAGKERQYSTAFAYAGYGYVFGGINGSNTCLNDVWKYDPVADAWSALPDFPGTARQGMCSFIIKDKAYIAGGKLADGTTILKDVWEYSFGSGNWTQKNDLPVSGMWRGSGFSIDTIGYICYGLNAGGSYNHAMYSYNALTDSWTLLPGLNFQAKKYIGTATKGNGAYLYGGQDSLGTITNEFLTFDAMDHSIISRVGIPTFARKGGMAFILNNTFYFTTGATNTARVKETWKVVGYVGMKEEPEMNSMTIYPNPASTALTISIPGLKKEEAMVKVYNYAGEIMLSTPFHETIDVSMFHSGLYILEVVSKTQVFKSRFVKD